MKLTVTLSGARCKRAVRKMGARRRKGFVRVKR